jgi:hypothetical protein
VTFGGGEGGFSPDLIGLISPAAKVTSSLMLEEKRLPFSYCFPECIIPFATKRDDIVAL